MNEISITATLAATNTYSSINSTTGYTPVTASMTGEDMIATTQTFSSGTWSKLNLGDIGTVGFLMVQNKGEADLSLSYAANGSSPFAKVRAGALYLGTPTSNTIYGTPASGSVVCSLGATEE